MQIAADRSSFPVREPSSQTRRKPGLLPQQFRAPAGCKRRYQQAELRQVSSGICRSFRKSFSKTPAVRPELQVDSIGTVAQNGVSMRRFQ